HIAFPRRSRRKIQRLRRLKRRPNLRRRESKKPSPPKRVRTRPRRRRHQLQFKTSLTELGRGRFPICLLSETLITFFSLTAAELLSPRRPRTSGHTVGKRAATDTSCDGTPTGLTLP